jgi:hypothetical protein
MMASARAHVASSFTLIKGAMIDQTYAVFAAWDFARSKRENLDLLREKNSIGASTSAQMCAQKSLATIASLLANRKHPSALGRPDASPAH